MSFSSLSPSIGFCFYFRNEIEYFEFKNEFIQNFKNVINCSDHSVVIEYLQFTTVRMISTILNKPTKDSRRTKDMMAILKLYEKNT